MTFTFLILKVGAAFTIYFDRNFVKASQCKKRDEIPLLGNVNKEFVGNLRNFDVPQVA